MDQYIFPVMWIQGHMFLVVWQSIKSIALHLQIQHWWSFVLFLVPLNARRRQCLECSAILARNPFSMLSQVMHYWQKKCFISFLKMKTLFLGTRSKDSKVKSEMNENKAPGAFPQIKPWLGIRCLTPGIKCFPLAKTQKRGFSPLVFGGTLPCPQLSTWPAT